MRVQHLALLLVLLTGCGKVSLYNDLPEQESNEMMALLLQNGIDADKTPGKEGVSLSIPKNKVPLAISLLHAHGYPEQRYTNVNEVFGEGGLVTTDFERKVRFNYALSQEISETLSKMDGVIYVRVHLSVIEEGDRKQVRPGQRQEPEKLSAAVFVKYNSGHNLDSEIPKIKQLVSSSVSNLDYQDVSVSLSPSRSKSAPEIYAEEGLRTIPGLDVKLDSDSVVRFYIFAGIGVLVVTILAVWIVLLLRRKA